MYYETPYNTKNKWYPDLPDGGRTYEDYINASCYRMTRPFNPLTGDYDLDIDDRAFGIDIVNQIFGDLGDDGKIKAIIGGHQFCTSWASYLCGVERYEYGASCPLGPSKMGDRWLEIYQNQFEETPFCWLAGLQCQITYPYYTNNAICQTHFFKAD
jgi:hypothetical protein